MNTNLKRGVIDLSSVIWTCLLASEDKEHGRKVIIDGKNYRVNSASFGYENAVNHLTRVMDDLNLVPIDLIFVMEGKNSKAERQNIYPAYKAGRDKCPEQYEQFNLCKQQVMNVFLKLGSQVAFQDGGVEADDVIGYLAKNLKGERWIVSGDKDLAVMVGGDIHHYRRGIKDQNVFGPFSHKFIPVCIALVGDASDGIKGARGFGAKSFEQFLIAYGDEGLELLEGLIKTKMLRRLAEDVEELPCLQKVIDDAESVYTSYELARLRIEKVNTLRRPLSWKAGMVRSREMCDDERLRKYAGSVRIVSAENYDTAFAWAKKEIAKAPFVSLDIETSTPPESDEWLEAAGKSEDVDVFGSEPTSLQMTFGENLQYTVYLPVDNLEEPGVTNLTVEQVAAFVDLVPRHIHTVIQNVSFELPICYMSWGGLWKDDPLFHGFIRNAIDTKIMSSYVDENRRAGLKDNSKFYLDYEQITFKDVTTKEYVKSEWNGIGKVLQTYMEPQLVGDMITHDVEKAIVQHKMNQLTARAVLSYGADDTICTAALAVHFRIRMELENTWDTFLEVEQYPAYLTALAYTQGTRFSLESMSRQEKDDTQAYDEAWPVLRDYLIRASFEGTVCPIYTELTPANVKEALFHATGIELKTMVRMPSKLAKLIGQEADTLEDGNTVRLFAAAVDKGDLATINGLVRMNFKGEPVLDLASSKQMSTLLYDHMRLPVRIVNNVTDIQREKNPDLDLAIRKFKQVRMGKVGVEVSGDDLALVRTKAKADDTAIETALAFDLDQLDEGAKEVLLAIGTMKRVMTRRSLFYANYWHAQHWKDGKVHSNINQCAAVTRRYSSSNPNLQQLPKKGEGARFREHFVPHHEDAVIASEDFGSQELRLIAEESQDRNLLACYIGDNLRDVHSMTAAGAMKMQWGATTVEELFVKYAPELPRSDLYGLFVLLRKQPKTDEVRKKADDLRKNAKNVVFTGMFGGQAVKVAETLVMPLEDAQQFLDAKKITFPGIDKATERAEDDCKKWGYATTMLGARRHLGEGILSDDRGEASRAARQAFSMRIQGSAAEMTKLAMGRLWRSGALHQFDVRFIAPIHDELVVSVARKDALAYLKIQHECMTAKYAHMSVPIVGSISIGPDFGHQIECRDEENNVDGYFPGLIEKALNDIFKEKT